MASFKVREGFPIGCKVTLRRERMYEFLDRRERRDPAHPGLPGLNRAGVRRPRQLHLGIREQIIFPEINYDQVDAMRGMDIAITTTAKANEEARALLEAFDSRSV